MIFANPAGANIPSGDIGERIRDQKKSFQTNEKIKTDSAAIAGRTRGNTITLNIWNSLAPSTRAASSNSVGIWAIKFLIKKTQKPV